MTDEHDPRDDLTMGQMHTAVSVWNQITESIMTHSITVLAEPHHKCEEFKFNYDEDEGDDDLVDMGPEELLAYFAFESSALEMFRFMRLAMISDGMPATELHELIAESYASPS